MSHAKRFGRKERLYDPRVPHFRDHFLKLAPKALPSVVDWSAGMPSTGLGMFFNDSLGDCTCAAVYHGMQVWTTQSNPPMLTEPDTNAELLYEQACGYKPGDPSTDQGGSIQTVLGNWLTPGVPFGADGSGRQILDAFVEIDQQILADIKQAILQCGVVDIGFLVPAFFNTDAPVWDVDPGGDQTITDGHSVVLIGYNDSTQRFKLISWGQLYEMTYAFFSQFCDESYGLANGQWFKATGLDPDGQVLSQLEDAMAALKWTGPTHDHRWHIKRKKRHLREAGIQP